MLDLFNEFWGWLLSVAILEASVGFFIAAFSLLIEGLGRFDKVVASLARYRLVEFRDHLDALEKKLAKDSEGEREAELAKLFAEEYDSISEPKEAQRFTEVITILTVLLYAGIIILDVIKTDTPYGISYVTEFENFEVFLFLFGGLPLLAFAGSGFYRLIKLRRKLAEIEARPSPPSSPQQLRLVTSNG